MREAFIKHCHARFMKYFFAHVPFGRKEVYAKAVMKATLERLARLIKVCGFLMQTKAYLFCSREKDIEHFLSGSVNLSVGENKFF